MFTAQRRRLVAPAAKHHNIHLVPGISGKLRLIDVSHTTIEIQRSPCDFWLAACSPEHTDVVKTPASQTRVQTAIKKKPGKSSGGGGESDTYPTAIFETQTAGVYYKVPGTTKHKKN